ncbi:hypothetical protein NL676_000861 [Syzygium grande]|nr:hypothetical protein NL676_000861 [Syzygium grande]
MDHAISIDEAVTLAVRKEKLEALKVRYVPTPNNQQQVGDGDLNKIMDRDLYEATKEGDVEKFIDALEKVSESRKLALSLIFDQVTPSGNSLLHVAASSGNDDVVELILIHFPYLVTRKNSSDDTPLHVAVQDGRLNATRKLISRRRDSDIIYWKNKDSKSPLYLAVENYKWSDWRDRKGAGWEILQLLLEASARDEDYAVKIQGMSPVLAALEGWDSGLLREIVKRLPKLLHVRDENGGHRCTLQQCHCLPSAKLIKDTWPDLAEIKNNKGQNILHVAAKAGNADAVIIITMHCKDADIKKLANSKDVDGNTPLHLASMHNHCPVMLYLTRDERSDLGLLNNDQLTALDAAMKSESLSTKYPAVVY